MLSGEFVSAILEQDYPSRELLYSVKQTSGTRSEISKDDFREFELLYSIILEAAIHTHTGKALPKKITVPAKNMSPLSIIEYEYMMTDNKECALKTTLTLANGEDSNINDSLFITVIVYKSSDEIKEEPVELLKILTEYHIEAYDPIVVEFEILKMTESIPYLYDTIVKLCNLYATIVKGRVHDYAYDVFLASAVLGIFIEDRAESNMYSPRLTAIYPLKGTDINEKYF